MRVPEANAFWRRTGRKSAAPVIGCTASEIQNRGPREDSFWFVWNLNIFRGDPHDLSITPHAYGISCLLMAQYCLAKCARERSLDQISVLDALDQKTRVRLLIDHRTPPNSAMPSHH